MAKRILEDLKGEHYQIDFRMMKMKVSLEKKLD